MSRVTFSTPSAVVTAGYDRPTQAFFLNVYDIDEEDFVVQEPVAWRTEDLHAVLCEDAGIWDVPEGFWERVERCEGNVLHEFADGAWKTMGAS